MIVTIENGTLSIVNDSVNVSDIDAAGDTVTLPLEVNVPLSFFRASFPTLPALDQGFEQLSYEPDNKILHVTRGGKVFVYERPDQDYLLKWIDNNASAIQAAGVEWRRNEIRGIANV